MNIAIRNALAVLAGLVIGSVVNIALVNLGPFVIPLPEGTDVTDMDSLRKSMQQFTPANFLFPFLGHALGTFVGAFATAKLAASHQFKCATVIGLLFLAGGLAVAKQIGGPTWFVTIDLLVAYIPMSTAGAILAGKTRAKPTLPA